MFMELWPPLIPPLLANLYLSIFMNFIHLETF